MTGPVCCKCSYEEKTVDRQAVGDSSKVGVPLILICEEEEGCSVVPYIPLPIRAPLTDVTDLQLGRARVPNVAATSQRECLTREIEDGHVDVPSSEKFVNERRRTAANIDDRMCGVDAAAFDESH